MTRMRWLMELCPLYLVFGAEAVGVISTVHSRHGKGKQMEGYGSRFCLFFLDGIMPSALIHVVVDMVLYACVRWFGREWEMGGGLSLERPPEVSVRGSVKSQMFHCQERL